jgi:hypothetical protein
MLLSSLAVLLRNNGQGLIMENSSLDFSLLSDNKLLPSEYPILYYIIS